MKGGSVTELKLGCRLRESEPSEGANLDGDELARHPALLHTLQSRVRSGREGRVVVGEEGADAPVRGSAGCLAGVNGS